MLFFRQLVHLLPSGLAWRVTVDKTLRRWLDGVSQATAHVRDFVDAVWFDLLPETTRELDRWEDTFGLTAASTDAARRLAYAAAWAAQGGQSPRYLQDVVQAAGFPLYVHEWWVPGSGPPVARNPHTYTLPPFIGTVQCSLLPFPSQQCCTSIDQAAPDPLPPGVTIFDLYPQCNRFLANEPKYIVNLTLTPEAPPPVPDDPNAYPYFLYFGGATFGTSVNIPADRRDELERLLLKLRPAQQWIVTLVNYV